MAATSQVCSSWATIADLCSPCDDYALDAAQLEDALLMASDVLYNFTGRRWSGLCEETVRPCATTNACDLAGATWGRRTCGCGAASEVLLPGWPVVAISEVKVDGDVVDPTAYRIDDGRRLVRLDGEGWPSCQVMSRDDTDERTFSVTYSYGSEPPIGGVRAAAALGCQLALACQPEAIRDGRCRLPKRITTITRQGVTLAVLDPLSLFADGITGLAEVDLWVASIRYGDRRRRATVVDPARPPSVRRTL